LTNLATKGFRAANFSGRETRVGQRFEAKLVAGVLRTVCGINCVNDAGREFTFSK
jgi:hypothetical protein